MGICSRIKQFRQEKVLTQKELADIVNVSPQVVSNWERDYTNPDHDDITRLSKAFGISTKNKPAMIGRY